VNISEVLKNIINLVSGHGQGFLTALPALHFCDSVTSV